MVKLSVIMPVYNEEKTIRRIIDKVNKVNLKNVAKEIVLVDDCSKDRTRDILKSLNNKSLKILLHKNNMGKGAAIRTGLKAATGDIILVQDADLEYTPSDYGKLLEPIIKEETKVVYGSRLDALRKDVENMYKLHYYGNLFLTFVTNLLYGAKITDMETCYKVFKSEVIKGITLRATRFDFEPEITAKILKKGYKIKEVPISFRGRKFEEGKKITWKDGVQALYYLIKYRFVD